VCDACDETCTGSLEQQCIRNPPERYPALRMEAAGLAAPFPFDTDCFDRYRLMLVSLEILAFNMNNPRAVGYIRI
jgi:hypothetical protein